MKTHECLQTTNNQPFWLSPFANATARDAQRKPAVSLCSMVAANACSAGKFCCDMAFEKLEVIVSEACRPDLRGIKVNGLFVDHQFSYYEGDHTWASIKFTNLLSIMPYPVNSELCLVMRPGACATESNLCYGGVCQASIFGKKNKCCPTWAL